MPQTAGLADLAHLRLQSPLPETADELCDVARSIGADPAEMRIGAGATETEVKRLSKNKTRLMSGPPLIASAAD